MSFLLAVGALISTLFLVIGPLPFSLAVAIQILYGHRKGTLSHYLLIGATLWLACQMATATGLAFLGHFALFPVLLCEALWLLAGWWLLRRTPRPAHLAIRLFSARNSTLPLLTLGTIGLLAAGNLLIQPTTDYDSLYYHLPFAANLHAAGAFFAYQVPAAVDWYPFGWEAFCALFLLPLSTDLLILTPNLLAWALLGLGLYCTTRTLGIPRSVAILPVLLLLSQPLLIDQLISLRVDLVLAALFVVGIAFTVADKTAHQSNQLLLLLLIMLLLAAVKMSGLIYALLLLSLVVARWLWHAIKEEDRDARWLFAAPLSLALLLLVGLTFATSTLWYGRNWLRYGNPMGEMALQLGGWQLFPGELTQAMVRQSTLFALFDPSHLDHWQLLFGAIWQKCELPGLLLLLLALVGLFGLVRSHRESPKWIIATTGGAFLLLWAIYWITPYSGNDGSFAYQLYGPWVAQSLRFALPAIAILGLLATLGVSRLTDQFPRLTDWFMVAVLIASLLSVAQRSPLYLLGVTGYAALLLLYLLLPSIQMMVAQRWARGWTISQLVSQRAWFAASLGVFTVAVLLLMLLQGIHAQQQRQLYGELPTLIAEISAPGDAIAAIDTHQSYLAQATSPQRRVFHLSHTFADADALQTWLTDEQISLLVIGPLRPEWRQDPLVMAITDPAEPYMLLWDGWEDRPRLYQFLLP